MSCEPFDVEVKEGIPVCLLANIDGPDGEPITQSSIASISWKVTDIDSLALTGSGSFAVANCVFDTLRRSKKWTTDSFGFNFSGTIPASAVPDGGRILMAEVTFVPSLGDVFVVQWRLTVEEVYGS